jgi:hypothetical protein
LNGKIDDHTETGLSVRVRHSSYGFDIQSGHGPSSGSAVATSSFGTLTIVNLTAKGSYPFAKIGRYNISPSIDYKLSIKFSTFSGVVQVDGTYYHDLFPNYEVRVAAVGERNWVGWDTGFDGPDMYNLNVGRTDSFGTWTYRKPANLVD